MATLAIQSNGNQQRTRTKQPPPFPKERQQQPQQSQAQQQQALPASQQSHPAQAYYIPQSQQAQYLPNHQITDVDGWRLQTLHSQPISTHPPRRSSRGPRTSSPVRSTEQQRMFPWDQPTFPQRQNFRRKSITSNTSSSDHHALLRSPRPSRSPSPGTPRSSLSPRATRTPSTVHEYKRNTRKMTGQSNAGSNSGAGCRFETALVNSRRRIPYSVGSDTLAVVQPGSYHARLDEKDERCLSVDILDLYHQLLPTEDTEERRRVFIDKLSKILRREFPNCYSEVHVFGSSENRLGTNSSDVDVCVVTTTKDMDDTCMLANILDENHFDKVVCVAAAKVPVVKIWDAELNIQCDINVNNSLAIENTRLVKLYVDIDERVRPLAMIIKYWAKSRLLNDAAGGGTLTSYTWILMVINFLQTRDPPILPSLHEIEYKQRFSNGIDVGFFDDIGLLKNFGSKNVESLGGLLYGFFVRFAFEFDYSREVISVRAGKTLSKTGKGWHVASGNNFLCVEEPFNTSRNLGNTADEATVKGLQLEFRRAVHYLADHASLELACWPYQFPTAENPRPERHLPNLPPQYRQMTPNNFRNKKYGRQQNSSPPFKSPKARAQDIGHQRHFNSFSGSRQQYPFNPLNLNPPMQSHVPIPSTPQSGMSSSMSSTMSPAGDMHHAYPPTPVDQLHYIDPFKNRQVAYYIPAWAPNGLPVYVPYTDDSVTYASPPQTPAMSETSLSHQPQYPRNPAYGYPQQQYQRGQSAQRGRPAHRAEVESPSTFREPQPLAGIGITTPGMTSTGPPYIPPPMKRRNSLPKDSRPNVPIRPAKFVTESYAPSPSTMSQGLAGSMSSVGGSDVFEEDFFDRRYMDDLPETSETPRPTINGVNKNDEVRSPGTSKVESPGLPAGKSYAAALLNSANAPLKSPTMTQAVKKDVLASAVTVADKEKKRTSINAKMPSISLDAPSPPTSPPKKVETDRASVRSASPTDLNRKLSTTTTLWTNSLHPVAPAVTPTSPPVSQARRPSIQSTTSNSPKKTTRLTHNTKVESRRSSIVTIPDSVKTETPTTVPTKKRNGRKNKQKKKENNNTVTSPPVTNGISHRQSISASA